MKKPLPQTIRLRGIRFFSSAFESKTWLDNTLLKLDKSLKIKAHSLRGFNWGDDEKGGLQFALAICIELYPPEQVKQVYQAFQKAFLADIQQDSFDLKLDLEGFNREFSKTWP